jgi:HEAT repeat protein
VKELAMTVTMEDVRAALMPDEPQYEQAARELGPEALPHLEALLDSGDLMLASKATYLASMVDAADTTGTVRKAAESQEPIVRVAAAGAARFLDDNAASAVLRTLVDDQDLGVRAVALKSVPARASSELVARVEAMARERDLHPELREISQRVLRRTEGTA